MVFLIALLLGLVQGLCEFLPVSSSGHLFLIAKLTQGAVNEDYFGSFFTVMLHIATLIAVVIVYREQILSILNLLSKLMRRSKPFLVPQMTPQKLFFFLFKTNSPNMSSPLSVKSPVGTSLYIAHFGSIGS